MGTKVTRKAQDMTHSDLLEIIYDYGTARAEMEHRLSHRFTSQEHAEACKEATELYDTIYAALRMYEKRPF